MGTIFSFVGNSVVNAILIAFGLMFLVNSF